MHRTQRLSQTLEKHIFPLVFALTFPLFYLRGQNYNAKLLGDDAELMAHALNRVPPFGYFSSLDSWGLLDPFNGYLAVYLRLITKLVLLMGDESFIPHTFWVMSVYWSVISGLLAYTIKRFAGAAVGCAAGFVLAVMPYSNLAMLAQVNTIAWPACLLTLIVVGTREYPLRRFSKLVLLLLFAGTAASTGAAIVTVAVLGINVLRHREKCLSFEQLLFACTASGFALQYLSFTPRDNPSVPLIPEILKISFGFAPQSIRAQILQPLSSWQNFILYVTPIVFFLCIGLLCYFSFHSNQKRVLVGVQFIGEGMFLVLLLTTANGWLNSHYLFIPTALLWIGVILIGSVSIRNRRWSEFVLLVIAAGILLMGISGTYFVT